MKNFRQTYRPKKSSLVVGWAQVKEAIESGIELDRVYLQHPLREKWVDELKALAQRNSIPINQVPVAKLNGFNVKEHGGVIGQIARIHYQELQSVISWVVENGETPLFVLLDGITDIRNIGGIARSAYCCGVHALVIPTKGVGALNEDAILTSAGALEKIAVCRVTSLLQAVDELRLNGIRVFASAMSSRKRVFDCDFRLPSAIVMGSEEKGIYPALLAGADEKFKIPMIGDFESLNVGVATGMILYEAMRQRLGA